MIRCMIVDDEEPARALLENFIIRTQALTLVAKCRNAMEAFSQMEQHAVDLIFLDINMPLINGLNFLKSLSDPPQIILTTAYTEYALEGYELNVLDYLLKPFSYERFAKAIAKFRNSTEVQDLSNPSSSNLIIREKAGIVKVPYSHIIYVEASKDYMKIITQERQYLALLTMKRLEEELPAQQFIRIHKSYIVGIDYIKIVKSSQVLISDNRLLPVGESYKEKLIERFRKNE